MKTFTLFAHHPFVKLEYLTAVTRMHALYEDTLLLVPRPHVRCGPSSGGLASCGPSLSGGHRSSRTRAPQTRHSTRKTRHRCYNHAHGPRPTQESYSSEPHAHPEAVRWRPPAGQALAGWPAGKERIKGTRSSRTHGAGTSFLRDGPERPLLSVKKRCP